jgi:hypothetical protein
MIGELVPEVCQVRLIAGDEMLPRSWLAMVV